MPSVSEQHLSQELLARAIHSGAEYGWRFQDMPAVLVEARALGLAVLGGQVQFKLPGGTCELYWHNADASPRRDGETWLSYVDRSNREVRAGLEALPSVSALVTEGIERFAFLKQRAAAGADLAEFLCFICYLDADKG